MHFSGPSPSQHLGAFVHGGAGGDDVVDEEDYFAADGFGAREGEGASDVAAAFGGRKLPLGRGEAGAGEGVEPWPALAFAPAAEDALGLVVAALGEACGVKGHGDDGLDAALAEVVRAGGEQPGERSGGAGAAAEFELVEEGFDAGGVVAQYLAGGEGGEAAAARLSSWPARTGARQAGHQAPWTATGRRQTGQRGG